MDQVQTYGLLIQPRGFGWKVIGGYYADGFVTDSTKLQPVSQSALTGKEVEGNISELKKAIKDRQDIITTVWFEEITEPMGIWQIVYIIKNEAGVDIVRDFYSKYFGKHRSAEGLYYARKPLITDYNKAQLNNICEKLGHEPLYRKV